MRYSGIDRRLNPHLSRLAKSVGGRARPADNPDKFIQTFSWQKSKRGAQALTKVFFWSERQPTYKDFRMCYPLVSDGKLKKGETKTSLAFAIANTTQIKVNRHCMRNNGGMCQTPVLDGSKVYATVEQVDGLFRTVLYTGEAPYSANGEPVVFLGIMKLTWYPGDTHCEVTLCPMKI